MIIRNSTIIILFILSLTHICIGQSTTITGVVFKENPKEFLPFVSIAIKNSSKGTISDLNGGFSIAAHTDDTLLVSSVGYKAKTIPVVIFDGTITLEENVTTLSEITIHAKRKKTIRTHIGNLKGKTDYILGGSNQYAFLLKNDRYTTGRIEELYFNIQPDISKDNRQETTVRIRLYKNVNNTPGEDLLNESIVVRVKRNLKNLSIDLTEYSIALPEEGVFIGLDLLGTTDEKNVFTPYDRHKSPLNLRIEFTKNNLHPTYRKFFGTNWTRVKSLTRAGQATDISAKFGAKVTF